MDANYIEINTLVYQDEQSCWVAQGLQYDITAVAPSIAELPDRFASKVFCEMAICADLGKKPLEGIKSAPQKFWKLYEQSQVKLDKEISPIRLEDHMLTPRIIPRMRLTELVGDDTFKRVR